MLKKTNVFHTIFAFVMFFLSIASNNRPYIGPNYYNVICWFVIFPLAAICLYKAIYCHKGEYNPGMMDNLRKYLLKKARFYQFILLMFLASMIVLFLSSLPVLPTRVFAHKPFEMKRTITNIFCSSSTRSGASTSITFSVPLAIGQSSIYFPKECTNDFYSLKGTEIVLYGRTWLLGNYVDGIKY